MFDIGNIIKNIGGKLNLESIARMLISKIAGGDEILNQAMNMAKSGQSPQQVMSMLENMKPEYADKLKGNKIWENMKNKNQEEIVEYAKNMATTLNLIEK